MQTLTFAREYNLLIFFMAAIGVLMLFAIIAADLASDRLKRRGKFWQVLFGRLESFPPNARFAVFSGLMTVIIFLYLALLVQAWAPWYKYDLGVREVRLTVEKSPTGVKYLRASFILTNSGARAFDGYVSVIARNACVTPEVKGAWPQYLESRRRRIFLSPKGEKVVVAYSLRFAASIMQPSVPGEFNEAWVNVYKLSGMKYRDFKILGQK